MRVPRLILISLFVSRAVGHSQYSVSAVPLISEWTSTQAAAINVFGDVAGTATDVFGRERVFLYQDAAVLDLGSLGGPVAYVHGMNDLGDVVGTAPLSDAGNYHAFHCADGQMRDIGALSSGISIASAVNNSRRVVGRAANPPPGLMAFYLDEGSDVLHPLGDYPGATGANVKDVNESGNIVGYLEVGSQTRAFLWTNGVFTVIGHSLSNLGSVATSMNDRNDIVGYYADTNYVLNGFLFSKGAVKLLGAGIANSINNLGQIVGESDGSPYFRDYQGENVELNTLIDTNSGWTVLRAIAINDAGQIAATGVTNGTAGPTRALLLTPLSRLVAPTVTSNQFEITLQSPVNETNRIQVSTDLRTWFPYLDLVAQSPLTKITTNLNSNSALFFRLAQ